MSTLPIEVTVQPRGASLEELVRSFNVITNKV